MQRVSINATGARCAVRGWGVLCGVRVARSHAPERRTLLLSSLIARVWSKDKQHSRAAAHQQAAAAVDKTNGAVIDVASAPCQPNAAYSHMTLPAFTAASR